MATLTQEQINKMSVEDKAAFVLQHHPDAWDRLAFMQAMKDRTGMPEHQILGLLSMIAQGFRV